ncbi:MAG: amidohydrolase family protein [Planctomycetes bacterium]|nr:amidohydrolase family protein [Planctomycetota bacterium]
MITRATQRIAIEGQVVSHRAVGENETLRQRIEIDLASGRIVSVEDAGDSPSATAADLVLGEGYWIFPGLVDLHVHAREDTTSLQCYKESFETAGLAAIHGGVTAFADMPNNPRPPVDDDSYGVKREIARRCPVDVLLYAGIGPRTRPLSFPAPYKAYMGPSVGDLYFESADALREALARYRGKRVSFHAEAPEVLERHRTAPTHAERRPAAAEAKAVDLAVRLSQDFGIEANICHLSTAEGLEHIRTARRRGVPVTCEVTPHHLFYDQDNAAGFAEPAFLQSNPPIRSRLDRIALLEAFREGGIDYLASDHAPHSLEENERGISGVPHLDTFGAFVFWLLDEGVSLRAVRLAAAERPGRFLSQFLPDLYGKVEKGFVGSLTILRREPQVVRRSGLKTRAGWSPFEGQSFSGRVSHTIVRGKIYPQIED